MTRRTIAPRWRVLGLIGLIGLVVLATEAVGGLPARAATPPVPPLVDAVPAGVEVADGLAVDASLVVVDDVARPVVTNGADEAVELSLGLHELDRADGGGLAAGARLGEATASLLTTERLVLEARTRARLTVPLPEDRDTIVLRLAGDGIEAPLDVVAVRTADQPDVRADLSTDGSATLTTDAPVVVHALSRAAGWPGRVADVDHGLLLLEPGTERRLQLATTDVVAPRVRSSVAATVLGPDGGVLATATAERTTWRPTVVVAVVVGVVALLAAAGVLARRRDTRRTDTTGPT